MIQIDEKLLKELGIDALPVNKREQALSNILEAVQNRVGLRIADQLDNNQLKEFDGMQSGEQKTQWLRTQVPNYDVMVREELDKVKTELKTRTDRVMNLIDEADKHA